MHARGSLLVFASTLVASGALASDGHAEFEAAIALEGQARWNEAASALERFARDHPEHTLAPDAMAEAAQLCEARLYEPVRSKGLWTQLETRYPTSRDAHRAGLHRRELERELVAGEDAVASFDRLVGEAGARPSREAREQMSRLLATHPHFPLADHGLVWLGQAAEAVGEPDEALARYADAMAVEGPEAVRAARARADLLLRLERLDEAQAGYEGLVAFPDPVARIAHDEGLAQVRGARHRRALARVSVLVLASLALLALALGHRRLWPPVLEVRFFAPVAALFAFIGSRRGGLPARAITLVAVGSVLVLWLAGAVRLSVDLRVLWKRLALALSTLLSIVAVVVLAIVTSRLGHFVLETVRFGPDR